MAKKKKTITATYLPEFEYTQYDIDMFTKYGDWEDDDETGLTQEDIAHAVKYRENPFD